MLSQLSVFIENKKGNLVRVTQILKENDVDIRAIAVFDTPEFGILRLIVIDPQKGKEVLNEKGYSVRLGEVIGIELTDELGSLNTVLELLSDNDITINYIYSFVLRKEGLPVMVMNVNDMRSAKETLEKNGISLYK
ncbi:MAG: amino acid-binding domain protein [Clostridiales bacterium]|jgi:hypothetical protein|nr:amino acid-binding domain protein [Clostridiales bacterium]